jgi:hypothetical protein
MGKRHPYRQQDHGTPPANAAAVTPEIEVEDDPSAQAEEIVHVKPEPKADDPYEILQREYDSLKASREREKADYEAQLAQRERQRAELENQFSQKVRESDGAVLYHALAAARSDADQATYAYTQARAAGDYTAEAAAQRALARAEANILRLEDGQAAFEAQKTAAPQVQRADPIEEHLKTYTPATQAWLRKHQGDIFGSKQRGNKAFAGHVLAEEQGITPDTDEYFQFLDEHMGYSQSERPAEPRTSRVAVSAPVSRSSQAGNSPTRVKLTAREAETADRMGIPREKYAANKMKIANGQAGRLHFEHE